MRLILLNAFYFGERFCFCVNTIHWKRHEQETTVTTKNVNKTFWKLWFLNFFEIFSAYAGRLVGAPSYIANCESSQAVHDLYNRIIQIHQNQQLQEQQKQQQQQQQQQQKPHHSKERHSRHDHKRQRSHERWWWRPWVSTFFSIEDYWTVRFYILKAFMSGVLVERDCSLFQFRFKDQAKICCYSLQTKPLLWINFKM